MKKKILFVIDSLHCAGAEKSLITLLSLIDYSVYEIDLQLFGYGGSLEELIPKKVKLLKPLQYTEFANLSIKESILYSIRKMNFKMLNSRIKFSKEIRKEKYSNAQKARLFWQCASNAIEINEKEYDIAISYAQGIPTFYVSDKIKARKKYAWVNVSYRLDQVEKTFQKKYYDRYNKIIAVSHSTKDILLETFPEYHSKIEIIYDINDPNFIFKMANIGKSYEDEFNGIKILTIGRLAMQKGYDIALDTCKKLKEKDVNFRWYALGVGPLKEEIEKYIKENDLENNFKLLGVKPNPYPYIKDCDIYVQTSKFEGFGLAIAEARMLNKPIVTTRFDAVFNQMIHEKNGLVVDMNSQGVYEGIVKLINDSNLRRSIVEYLREEKKGNLEEFEKFHKLLESS
ncbi:glycosyltransferase [Clostridium sp. LIBA-8841]|uniref:glycosyltransferase n=1 Tax=Clostridium sp. LIBA-8841 TaxID=2987530 RepID=UPI002AC7AC43|nr:glycosyltransferase [Clostridium sp. LIBA-8841]MDZ5254374.1 glycosyltransferase [Clostridium sp. LIBA-8841]